MKNKFLSPILIAVVLCFPTFIFAEIVVLKSGKTIEGKLIEKTDEYITIDFLGVPLTYFVDEIERIEGGSGIKSSKGEDSTLSGFIEKTPSRIFEEAAPAIVVITAKLFSGTSQGSGFVVDKSGVIVTNVHVVAGAENINIKFKDGREYPVTGIVAYDPRMDICMLKIDAFNLATLPLGNSDNLKPGQKVLVIGAPLGLEYSISDGLFSSVRPEFYQETLQFTAPISPGNSGGPLLDMQGKVVGIVTYIKVGGSDIIAQNLNFAVSVNQAKTLIPTSPAVKFKVEEFRKNLENNYSNSILACQAEAYGKYEEALKYYRDALKGCYQPYNKECLWRIIDLLKLSAFLSYLSWQEKDYAKASHYSNGCINTIEAFGGPEYLIKEITKGAIFPGERLSKFKEHTVGTGYFLSGYLYLLNNDENGANRCKEKLKMFAPEAARNLEEGISEWQKEKNTVQFPKNMGPYGKKEFISEEKAKFPAEEDIRIIENLDLETGSLFGKAKDAFLKKENSLAIEYLDKTLSRLRKYSPEYNVIFKYKIVSHQQQAIDYGVKGLDDEAIKSYEKTISLIGSSQDAFLQEKLAGCYFGLGIIYARNRNRDKAEWCLRKLQELRTADSGESVNILGKEVYK